MKKLLLILAALLTIGGAGTYAVTQTNDGGVLGSSGHADNPTDPGTITLGSLGDVTITSPTDGEVLSYDNGTGEWIDSAVTATAASRALDNLASVALNTALLPDAAAADDFGSATLPFKDIYIAGSSGTPGTNNFKITGASTSGTRVITLPNATVTLNAAGDLSGNTLAAGVTASSLTSVGTLTRLTVSGVAVGPILTVTSSATGYTNGGGTVEFGRTGNLTGVAGESFSNVKIAPAFDFAKPATGTTSFSALNIDTTGMTWSGSAGSIPVVGLRITSGVTTNDGYGIYVLGRNNRLEAGKSDGSNTFINNVSTTGVAAYAQSTSNVMTSGNVLRVDKTATGGTTAYTGSVGKVLWTQNHNAAATLDHTANGLDVSRAITSNHASAAITVSGALATLNSTNVQTLGTMTDTGNILKLTQGYASASGDVISIANSGTGKDISGTGSTWSVSKAGYGTFAGLNLPHGTTIPATCAVGDVYLDTDSDDCADTGAGDGALCICGSTNVWKLISNF
jgi:hypothetical protein